MELLNDLSLTQSIFFIGIFIIHISIPIVSFFLYADKLINKQNV